MARCLFASDLHGRRDRWTKLFEAVVDERPDAVFLGGDLLPSGPGGFVREALAAGFERLRERLAEAVPRVFVVLGNDDPRAEEPGFLDGEARGLWTYLHGRRDALGDRAVYGYACTPPSPFALKDWERYDVSRFVDPGCVAPEDGRLSVPVPRSELESATIRADLDRLAGGDDVTRAVFLFHAPPYGTALDRAALDRKSVDHAPLDVHVGSIAIRRFIERRRPAVTLHGHVHESARLTGSWRDRIGPTHCLGAAHDGPELALVRFDPDRPAEATRELV